MEAVEYAKGSHKCYAGGIAGYEDGGVLTVPGFFGIGFTHDEHDLAARVDGAGDVPFASVEHVLVVRPVVRRRELVRRGGHLSPNESDLFPRHALELAAGQFTQPDVDAKGMQEFCVEALKKQGMPSVMAWLFTRQIPKLSRWQN